MGNILRKVKESNIMSKGTLVKRVKRPGSNELQDESHGEYGYPLAPGSFQSKRVQWSDKQGKYLIDLSEEELQKFVKRASLRYLEGSKQGEPIEKANIYDRRDPFFEHPELNMWMNMGVKDTQETNTIDKVVMSNIRLRSDVSRPGDDSYQYRSLGIEYEIVDTDHDKRIQNKETEREFELANLIRSSNFSKKSKIADIIGVSVDKDMKEADLNTLLYRSLKVSPEKTIEFIEKAQMTNEDLQIEFYITKAMSTGFRLIRWTPSKNMYIMNGEHELGRKKEDVKEFLVNPDNHAFLEELIELVDAKL